MLRKSEDGAEAETLLCKECNLLRPKKAHHCNLCKACILEHDHHCFFTGSCIGKRNTKYFVVWTLWLFIGCVYGGLMLFTYVHFCERWNAQTTIIDYYIIPSMPIRWIMGRVTFYHVCVVMCFHVAILGTMIAGFMSLSQIYLLLIGRTSFEFRRGTKKMREYKLHYKNWKTVFVRKYWLIDFIVPCDMLGL
jgi:palmitoyltransferase